MPSLFDPTEQLQLTCDTPDEFQQKVIGWDIEHIQLARGSYQVDVDIIHTRNIQFSNATHYVGIQEQGCITQEAYAISLPTLLSTNPLHFCGGILERDECPVLMSGDEYRTLSKGGINYFTIVIDTELLDREAVQLTGHPFASLVHLQRVIIKRQDRLRLVYSISKMMQELKKYPHHLPTMQQNLLEKEIVEQLLLSIRRLTGKKIKIPSRRQAARKAAQLIRQDPQQQLNIEQLCKFTGCSARNLHLGFKERYGVTPRKYARILALNTVRYELCHLHPGESISEIAMKSGFYHLGRFSQQYEQLFTELPSVTMKQNRLKL